MKKHSCNKNMHSCKFKLSKTISPSLTHNLTPESETHMSTRGILGELRCLSIKSILQITRNITLVHKLIIHKLVDMYKSTIFLVFTDV